MDFCNYAMQIDGQITDQLAVYNGASAGMMNRLGQYGNQMIERLGLNANISVTKPIAT
jgi:hypothetical protein